MVFNLNKAHLSLILFSFPLLLLALAPLRASAATTYPGTPTTSSVDIHVDHSVQIQEGGLVLINDTIKLSAKLGERVEPIQNVSIGFPFQFGSNLTHCYAYEVSNPEVQFEVVRDVGLGRVGFYGIDVIFPEPIDLSDGKSHNFTVVFVFSNLVSPVTKNSFKLNFPLYPSLTEEASLCSVTVALPYNAEYMISSLPEEGFDFNITTIDSRLVLNHTKSPLEHYTHEPAWLTFSTVETFLLIDVKEIRREITLDEWGHLLVSDFYHLNNEAEMELSKFKIQLPKGAYGVSARDVLGELSVVSKEENVTTYTNVTVSFRTALKKGETGKFAVNYLLPWKNYVNKGSWLDFNITFPHFECFEWRIRNLSVTINLPEGAKFNSSSVTPQSLHKNVFQEVVTFILYDITSFHDLNFYFSYRYLIFWASFRPTLWVGTLVGILGAIALIWKAPKIPVPIFPIPSEDLRSFVASYDEKRRILSELESIEDQVRKRKISRRRYKVRRRTLGGRLSVLSRNLAGLRDKIREVGPRYANMMRQIEVAETELEEAETGVRRIRTRYRRKEISTSVYRNLLKDYNRRRDRARTTIDGVLLRLRE